jgi:sulfoxide reductase heme-binding subunit YedZ
MAGLFVALMLYRFAHWRGWSLRAASTLIAIALIAGLATAGIEYAWYALATGIPAERVAAANLEWMWPLRPAWNVVVAALVMVVIYPFGRDGAGRAAFSSLWNSLRLKPQHLRGG